MKRLAFIFLLFFVFLKGEAQPYAGAVGLRIGFNAGVSGKFFMSQKAVCEILATYQFLEHGFGLTGLYEHHNYRMLKSNHFAVFYGGGLHLAYYTGGYYKNREKIVYVDNVYNVGIDVIIGLDYHEPGTPLNWSLDVKPMFDFVNAGLRIWDGAVSVRYAF